MHEYRRQLTDRIIEQLEAGTAPWIKPWSADAVPSGPPRNALTGREYRGGNRLWLDCQGYDDARWCTYRQAREQGWQVRRGEQATHVEYWQWDEDVLQPNGSKAQVKLAVPRVYYASVFNAAQIDGMPESLATMPSWAPHLQAEKLLTHSGAILRHDQRDRAFYALTEDAIHLPSRMAFDEPGRYYATALHELGHWTGHPSRLNRDLGNSFGSEGYAREELRAELGSYFTCSQVGIAHDPGAHAAYIGSWVEALRRDPHAIFRAAKEADAIADYVLQFVHEPQAQHEEMEC